MRLQKKEWDRLSKEEQEKPNSLDGLVAIYRKLREGIVSSQVHDSFTLQVYESAVDICLLSKNFSELIKTLSPLVNSDVYDKMDHHSRRPEMIGYYLLYFICYARSSDPKRLYGNPQEILNVLKLKLKPEIVASSEVQFSLNVWKALIVNVDFVSMAHLWSKASINQKVLMEVFL